MTLTVDLEDRIGKHGDDRYAIACNLTVTTSPCSRGSLAYVLQIGPDRLRIFIRSRGGHWIQKWMAVKQLANFRFKTISIGDPVYGHLAIRQRFTCGDLATLAAEGAGQGLVLRD